MHNLINWISYSPRRFLAFLSLLAGAVLVAMFLFGCNPKKQTVAAPVPPPKPELKLVDCASQTVLALLVIVDGKPHDVVFNPGCRCLYEYGDEPLISVKPTNHPLCKEPYAKTAPEQPEKDPASP